MSLSGKARFVIGRDKQADWVLLDPNKGISAVHCEILFDGSQYVLRDLSTNGTFLNGSHERLDHPHQLNDGDTIRVGPFILKAEQTSVGAVIPPPPVTSGESVQTPPTASRTTTSYGDPAAMVSSGPTTPMKPHEPHAGNDAPAYLTMISPAPKPTGPMPRGAPVVVKAPEPALAPAPAQSVVAPVPIEPSLVVSAPQPAPAASPLAIEDAAAGVGAFLKGFGLEPDALAGIDSLEAAERLGSLTRGLLAGLKDALDDTARSRRQLGSRKRGTPRGQRGNALKFSARVEDALLLLLAMAPADAALETKLYVDELKAHQQVLLASAQAAARGVGEELDPKALSDASPNVGSALERKARLWDTYNALWQGVDADWATGLMENFKLLMASHYDDQTKS